VTDYPQLRQRLDEEGIEWIDLRAPDLVGRLRHITLPAVRFTEECAARGIGFDASNYGYCQVSGSDMVLVPDLDTAYVEERDGERLLVLMGDVREATTGEPSPMDPRRVVRRAEAHLREAGIADEVLVSPEFEFYLFEEALFSSGRARATYEVVPFEGAEHRDRPEEALGRRSAYHATLPQDRLFALRNAMTREIEAAGIPVKYHHHEVGPFGQHEIELGFDRLARMADVTLVVKSLVRNVAAEAGLTATFLPKPLFGEAGSGLHLHQYLRKGGRNLFRGETGLSPLALAYVGGLLTHGASLMALTNPSTNSYRRLVPGFEAPVHFVFGAANRSAAVRVPTYAKGNESRIELRTMDATCNPCLAYAAILLAGIDGIQRDLDAERLGLGPVDTDLHQNGAPERTAPLSLEEALAALEKDHDYLLQGGVFTEALIERWIEVKGKEAAEVSARPHPHEFGLYYDL
jgi:glutamine synthetase